MNLLEYTAAAYQYGPFFFAILFILVVTRWANKKYTEAYTNTSAPVKVQQTYRSVFISAFTFSCILVIVAILFYWKNPPNVHIFEGTIDNLQGYETVTSGDLYFKRTYKEKVGDDAPFHDDHFVVYQVAPFAPNQTFDLVYWKQGGKSEVLQIGYTAAVNPRFKIEFNEQTNRPEIKALPVAHVDLLTSAYAATTAQSSRPTAQSSVAQSSVGKTNYSRRVDVLQEESTAVGLKIATLDSIIQSSNPAGFLSVRTSKEAFALTLLDLSRHTDKELAYKAQQLLRIAQFDSKMINDLGSKDEQTVQAAEEALFRMEKSRGQRILDRSPLPEAQKKRLDDEMESGARTRLPIPTGTSQGDRYYIQAEWNTASAVQCVYRLFTQEDFSFARQEQYSAAPKGKPETKSIISNAYDAKAKALAAYDDIQRCHARPKFVAGF